MDPASLPGQSGYDIVAFAQSYIGKAQAARLSKNVKDALRTKSCLSDLAQATDCLDRLDTFIGAPPLAPSLQSIVNASLLNTAIIMYCRATNDASKGGSRPGINVMKGMSDEQRASHARMMDVRNTAVAHVKAGQKIGSHVWHQEAIVGIPDGGKLYIAGMTKSIAIQVGMIKELADLIERASLLVEEQFHREIDAIGSLIVELKVKSQVEQFPFSVADFLGSAEDAAFAWNNRHTGMMSGTSFWPTDR